METQVIADGPIIEVAGPPVHLRGPNEVGIVDEPAQHSGFVPARVPEREGELVIVAERLAHLPEGTDGNAERLARSDPVPRHAVAFPFGAATLKPLQQLVGMFRGRAGYRHATDRGRVF